MKGIDHLVLCGRDHPAMRAAYAALGFTLTPEARHPFGTGNSLIQLEGCFLELLSVFEPEKISEPEEGRFSFAAFNRDFLEAREGLSMLVLDSLDARADVAAFRAAGLRTYQPFDFSRKARLPDGREATVGFSLAFATDPKLPNTAFFTCQQHAPEHFWKPQYQRHPNRALTVLEVSLVAEKPGDHAAFLEGFSGFRAEPAKGGITIRTARGNISCVTPERFAESFARAAPHLGDGPRFGGFTIGVRRMARLEEAIADSGLKLHRDGPHRAILSVDVNGSGIAFFALNRQDAEDDR
ncbi:VOC family protein [Taklimakanibacter deserti]|uniref:VOC family protein n=1 Tax=Taklimakanibacter deserti TaxID=2267839 RepID=UPI000E65BCBC